MNIITSNSNLTMSSREIAEVTSKRHDNVKRTMESLFELGLISITQIEEPTKGGGKPTNVYHVNEDDSYIVVARLSPEFTAAIVKRWRKLEGEVKQPSWMIQLSPEAQIALNDLSSQLENKTRMVEQLENLFHNGGTIAQFVKQLNGVNSQQINNWLYLNTKWLYDENKGKVYLTGRKQGQPKPHSWRCAAYARDKYLTETNYNVERQGMEPMVKYEVQLLANGKKWLFDKYAKGKLPMKSNWDGKFTHKKDLA